MVKKLWLDTIPILLVITMFAFVLGVYYGLFEIPFLYQITTTTGQTMWHFDTAKYFINLNGAFNSISELTLERNPLEWKNTDASMLESEFWTTLLHNMAFIANWLIFMMNLGLFVIKFIAYLAINLLCIMGMVRQPTQWTNPQTMELQTYNPNWLMEIFTWLATNLQINYIIPD